MTGKSAGAAGGGAIYGLGIFGAWPAFMVYQVFRALA
jgi:hypothetical protein